MVEKRGEHMLKKFRIDKNMTQRELAYELDTSVQTISRYELGERIPKNETIQKIVEVLKLNNKQELELRRSFGKKD